MIGALLAFFRRCDAGGAARAAPLTVVHSSPGTPIAFASLMIHL